eukprot:7183010-Prymnesium_polylepis.1
MGSGMRPASDSAFMLPCIRSAARFCDDISDLTFSTTVAGSLSSRETMYTLPPPFPDVSSIVTPSAELVPQTLSATVSASVFSSVMPRSRLIVGPCDW